jgi:hypothetical protein
MRVGRPGRAENFGVRYSVFDIRCSIFCGFLPRLGLPDFIGTGLFDPSAVAGCEGAIEMGRPSGAKNFGVRYSVFDILRFSAALGCGDADGKTGQGGK